MKPQLKFLSLFLILIFSNCTKQKPKVASKPNWVIKEPQMVDMIADLRIIDAATYNNSKGAPRNKSKDYDFVIKKYKTHDSIFRNSHDYYCQYPKVLESLYEQALDKLSEMQASAYTSNVRNAKDTAEIVK
ncbi:MAG: DUF4296 domain-containing protein [Bacteroidetes bacterium]|nr:DUF4296 domain-containing protein [Bacteroidota bacterium]